MQPSPSPRSSTISVHSFLSAEWSFTPRAGRRLRYPGGTSSYFRDDDVGPRCLLRTHHIQTRPKALRIARPAESFIFFQKAFCSCLTHRTTIDPPNSIPRTLSIYAVSRVIAKKVSRLDGGSSLKQCRTASTRPPIAESKLGARRFTLGGVIGRAVSWLESLFKDFSPVLGTNHSLSK